MWMYNFLYLDVGQKFATQTTTYKQLRSNSQSYKSYSTVRIDFECSVTVLF